MFVFGAQTAPIDVPFRLAETAIIVDSVVNGKKAALMFDTGFSGSVIVDSSLNIGEPTGKIGLRDFVGQFEAETVKVKSLKLGAMTIDPTGMNAVKIPGQDNTMSYGMNCMGIMGFEVISKYVTEISFEKGKFIFYPNTLDITKRTPDNKRTFLAKLLPVGHSSMEMLVTASNGKQMILALDTGNSFYATTHRDVLERIGLWEPGREPKFMRSAFVASGEVASWYGRFKDLKVYGVPVPDSTWSIIDLPSSSAEHDGTVGFGFLKNFNITIDYGRRRVWLENFTGQTGSEPEADVGLIVGPRNDKVIVFRVAPESPAAKAGIKIGDMLLSKDGVDVTNIGFRRFMSFFDGKQGTKMSLAMSRNGQLVRHELVREYLVNDVK
jgi:predicted aspartyl protease